MEKDEETEIGVECSAMEVCFSFDVGRSMFDVGRSSFKIFLLTAFFTVFTLAQAGAMHKNSLHVEIDVERSQIAGVSMIAVNSGEELVFQKGSLKITGIMLDNRPFDCDESEKKVACSPDESGVVEIFFKGIYRAADQRETDTGITGGVVDKRGVSLTGIWYPHVEGLRRYELHVTLPAGYEAVSEAETIKREMKNGKVEFHFNFPHPVDGINLAASDRFRVLRDSYRDIDIYAYFFEEDLGLGKTYIEYTKKYLELYERLIDEYPYRRFSIVENFLPSGYSMPTFTLLGSAVVRLPFIVETSLGHEILHQWFGNHVYVDYENGNWAEGLTTYLADHYYKVQKDEGWKYRKQMLIDYKSYVSVEDDFPLKFFRGRTDRASRAMGYGKVAMVFHMLKDITGKKIFYDSLRDFIDENRFKAASWDDLRESFEKKHGKDLGWFFSQWIEKEGLPDLRLEDVELKQIGSEFELHFHVNHKKTFYKLNMPVTIYFDDTMKIDILHIEAEGNSFDFMLPDKPVKIVLDEDYDIARDINEEEFPPVMARLLGEKKLIFALREEEKATYESIVDELGGEFAIVRDAGDIKESELRSYSLILPGLDNPVVRRLYGTLPSDDAGFSISVKENPWNAEKVIGIINGKSGKEVEAAAKKMKHYGKYSKLLFNKGRNIEKSIDKSNRGIVMKLRRETSAVDISSIRTLPDVIEGVSDRKIIYVGEVHDVFAHHAVQLDIITGIYKKDPRLAIGMEMFQRPFQNTLDVYVAGRMGEQQFLRESEYFKRWGFDYNLYKPVLDFARTEGVPVVALNLQREIIEKVSGNGIGSLSEEEKKEIPKELDFSDNEYRERLKEVFSMHKHSEKRNFDYFYESQILWDETMSQSVDDFLNQNTDYRIIVLAGQGHLRYGSGIPKRTHRRNNHDYAVVLIDDKVDRDIADFVVFPKPVEGIAAPKLMAFLKAENGKFKITGFPEKSVSEKAGLKIEDTILFIDDVEINSIEDIKIYLLYKKTGDKIKVKILRKQMEMEIEVEL
jgi:uncharacterized iron-regulated protein